MNSAIRLAVWLGAGGVAVLAVGAWLWFRLRRRKSPAELERLRRLAVNRCGRITIARIVDLQEGKGPQGTPRLLFYTYEVAGVTYEAAQDISGIPGLQVKMADLAGQTGSVKYDTKKPTNSIIACEEWSGLLDLAPASPPRLVKSKEQSPPIRAAGLKADR